MACKTFSQRYRSSRNIVKRAVFFSEYSGESCQGDFKLAGNFREHEIDPSYIKLLHALDEESAKKDPHVKFTVEGLKALKDYRLEQISYYYSSYFREWFFMNYIPEIELKMLLRFLMTSSILPEQQAKYEEREGRLFLKSLVIESICQMSSVGTVMKEMLSSRDDILLYLFKLLLHKSTFIKSCDLIEYILLYRNGMFKLDNIANIIDLIKNFEDYQLTNFSRILALAIANEERNYTKISLYELQKSYKLNSEKKLHEHNQELVLSIPDILSRLVNLCSSRPYIPPVPKKLNEFDHWMIWIDRRIDDTCNLDEFIENFIRDLANGRSPEDLLQNNVAVRMSYNLSYKIQVFHVIGFLLSGKHREKVLEQLKDLKLIPKLSSLFDDFDWKTNNDLISNVNNRRPVISECPEVALKIQLLRLVHNFCDSEYKHLMLTSEEFQDVKNIQRIVRDDLELNKEVKLNFKNYGSSLMCEGPIGFLNKIIKVMTDATTHPSYLFWLSRIVESYLRGTMVYADQLYLMNKGLLKYILNKLIFNGSELEKEHRQCFFDLLGELMKFNLEAFTEFSQFFNTDVKASFFYNTMNRSLIDSNMFIRSMILSLDHFERTLEKKEISRIYNSPLDLFKGSKNKIGYLFQLLQLINVKTLTQENISCLNTSLVFLMLANKECKMTWYLRVLKEVGEKWTSNSQRLNVLQNLREMLLFWQYHYFLKEMEKDCISLEKNCRIEFDYWTETVAALVQNCPNSPLSLLHYLNEEKN